MKLRNSEFDTERQKRRRSKMGREGKVMRDWTRRLSRGMTPEERRELLESEIWVLGAKISHGPLHISVCSGP